MNVSGSAELAPCAEVIELITCPCCGLKPMDEAIRPLVHVLNAHGLKTSDSCCGHRGRARESMAHVVFWANVEGVYALSGALRNLATCGLEFRLCVLWENEVDRPGYFDVRFEVLGARGRAPKSTDLTTLAKALDDALANRVNEQAVAA